jgi:hypothetical protein
MGLNEGVNVFVNAEGKIDQPIYLPAYARRYPFMLAKLTPQSDDLSLCFDPPAAWWVNSRKAKPCSPMASPAKPPSRPAVLRTVRTGRPAHAGFRRRTEEAQPADGRRSRHPAAGVEQPFVYRGFQMVNQEKLREIRGDVLRGWAQSGLLPLVYAHIFSLDLMSAIFGMQAQQGKAPAAVAMPAL